MAIDFPASPANGATHTAAGVVWLYDGVKWKANSATIPGDITSVTAGTGLTGGGTVGDLTLALATPVSVANGGTGSTTAAAAPFVEIAGDTMTGALTIAPPGGWGALYVTKTAGTGAQVVGLLGSSVRWNMQLGDGSSESGSNAGSNFNLFRHNDAGAQIDAPLAINRATATATFTGSVLSSGFGATRSGANDVGLTLTNGVRSYQILNRSDGGFGILDSTAPAWRFFVDTAGNSQLSGNLQLGSGTYTTIYFPAWSGTYIQFDAAGGTMAFGVNSKRLWQLRNDNLAFNDQGSVAGNGGYINLASFAKYKSRVRPIENPAERLKKLKPVAYTFDPLGEEQHGFVIEDLLDAYPEAISYGPDGQPQGYKDTIILAGLTAALQDALSRIEALEGK